MKHTYLYRISFNTLYTGVHMHNSANIYRIVIQKKKDYIIPKKKFSTKNESISLFVLIEYKLTNEIFFFESI